MSSRTSERQRQRHRDKDPDRESQRTRRRERKQASDGEGSRVSEAPWDEEHYARSPHGSTRTTNPTTLKVRERRQRTSTRDRSSTPLSGSSRYQPSSMTGDDFNSHPTASFLESRTSLPYPTFSKAHSKEAVGSREALKLDILTPEPTATDITGENDTPSRKRSERAAKTSRPEAGTKRHSHHNVPPPSPPLTAADDQQPQRRGSTASTSRPSSTKSAAEDKRKVRPKQPPTRSTSSLHRKPPQETSGKTSRPGTPVKQKLMDALQFSHKPAKSKLPERLSESTRRTSVKREKSRSPSASTVDSDATSIAPNQPTSYQQPAVDPSPRIKTFRNTPERQFTPRSFVEQESPQLIGLGLPPPPPPPPVVPIAIPKVDYLLQNGGLGHHVPKNLLGARESAIMPQQLIDAPQEALKLFQPYTKLLDDYGQVLAKGGSLAVATGYRSVARRLLDRLEAVFARDISSEPCECLMCGPADDSDEAYSGVSWGEVLEIVSGREDLPKWPPFNINSQPGDFSSTEKHVPMQKLDIDVPEEHREHYVRQSRRTKQAVDKWLSRQPSQSTTPPDDVDDETLMFAMLTYLDEEQRATFSALLEIPMTSPEPKRETPNPRTRPEALIQSGYALQRLYRLHVPPRDPEVALFLLQHPEMHHVLATLAAISSDEWDILISGRFDGFLRSGAEDDFPPTSATAPPVGGVRRSASSRGVGGRTASQPHSNSVPSRSETPASFGAPISIDEESEIAALAEVERDIYLGMEALEDAFEGLHQKAEAIRLVLRERGAGLTVANQARRGNYENVEALPGSANSGFSTWSNGKEFENDDWIDDAMSEIAPSDSASNISSSRRRRPKRRTERRTPAPVEEEDEGEEDEYRNHTNGTPKSRRR
ncbi:hypothetical protein AJ80_09675 [Polytolypa hystricis UAMH7299]|uniref:5-Methylcytosine G/T mismatch-specific DNA glycosylase n=1 Tax=Polytolypa hystricis (strain UAMH7299) TaxID=1447883 RepID=A0A2B7WM32_POLH7|nr:hypothetical protein AJ80_09675 [Polytolypa hystricis UAMH7299]